MNQIPPNQIPFADLRPMHREIRSGLDEAYRRVLEKSCFIQGTELSLFEQEFAAYCGTKYCVGTASGLDAVCLALSALGIGPGDEVLVPANTFIATALAVSRAGAVPVFADPDIGTYNIDPDEIEKKITPRTKAVIAVHLQGRTADMDAVRLAAGRHGLLVVEDAAQAHGAAYKGKKAGSLSDAAAFSFYPGKNLGALGDGGCIVTDSRETAERARMLGSYGSRRRYFHECLGANSRLDELQAAFLRVKLRHLDKWNRERKKTALRYLAGIENPGIILPLPDSRDYSHVYHVFAVRHEKRDQLEAYLNAHGAGTARHYPVPLHLQKAYEGLGHAEGDFPAAEEISRTVLSLPVFYGMTEAQADTVIQLVNNFQ